MSDSDKIGDALLGILSNGSTWAFGHEENRVVPKDLLEQAIGTIYETTKLYRMAEAEMHQWKAQALRAEASLQELRKSRDRWEQAYATANNRINRLTGDCPSGETE